MKLQKFVVMFLVLVLTLALAIPALADDGTPEPPVVEETEEGDLPILRYFSAYYQLMTFVDCSDPANAELDICVNPPAEVDCTLPENADLAECLNPDTSLEELVMGFHEEGMGFGVLAKMLMVSVGYEDCPEPAEGEAVAEGEEAICTTYSFEEIVTMFNDGMNMGQFFKEFGKPAVPGMGGLINAEKFAEKCADGNGPAGVCGTKDIGKPDKANKGKKP